jgi:hypothetical protein
MHVYAPLHLIVFFHGAYTCMHAFMASTRDAVPCGEGPQRWRGYGLGDTHNAAGTRSLLVAPQFLRGSPPGRFARRGAFRAFLDELLAETLREALHGAHTLDDVGSITLIASSGGYRPLTAVLGDVLRDPALDARVRTVVLFDALYGGHAAYLRWLLARDAPGHARRRLVAVYTPLAQHERQARALGDAARAAVGRDSAYEPEGATGAAIRTHRVVVARSNHGHYGLAQAMLVEVLRALDLPARAGGAAASR